MHAFIKRYYLPIMALIAVLAFNVKISQGNSEFTTMALRAVVSILGTYCVVLFSKSTFLTIRGRSIEGRRQSQQLADTCFFALALPTIPSTVGYMLKVGVLPNFGDPMLASYAMALAQTISLVVYGFGLFLVVAIKSARLHEGDKLAWSWVVRCLRAYLVVITCFGIVSVVSK